MLQSKLCCFSRPYFQRKKGAKSSKSDLGQRPEQLLLEKLGSEILEIKTFSSLTSLEVAELCFWQSTLRIFASRLRKFPVLTAGKCYPISFATESALYHLSGECLIRRTGTGSSSSSYCTVDIGLDVLRWNCVLRKTQIYRMLASYLQRAIRLISGFAVAMWTEW